MNMNQAINSTYLGILELGGIFTSLYLSVWYDEINGKTFLWQSENYCFHFLKMKENDKFLVHDEPCGQKAFCFSPDAPNHMG